MLCFEQMPVLKSGRAEGPGAWVTGLGAAVVSGVVIGGGAVEPEARSRSRARARCRLSCLLLTIVERGKEDAGYTACVEDVG